MVFQYRHAHLFGRRCFIPGINQALGEAGRLTDPEIEERLVTMVTGFAGFCRRLSED